MNNKKNQQWKKNEIKPWWKKWKNKDLILLAIDQIIKIILSKKINILDIGTGSGVKAIELKKFLIS